MDDFAQAHKEELVSIIEEVVDARLRLKIEEATTALERQDFTRSVVQSIHSAIHGKPRKD